MGMLREEEEAEGEVLGESDTCSLLFPSSLFLLILLIKSIFVSVCPASFLFHNFPLQMNPTKRMGKQGPVPKKREDIDILRSWMEVGGHLAHPDEEAKGLLVEVDAFFSCSLYLSFAYLLPVSLTISML